MVVGTRMQEAKVIGGRGCRCEGKKARYETWEANPLVL